MARFTNPIAAMIATITPAERDLARIGFTSGASSVIRTPGQQEVAGVPLPKGYCQAGRKGSQLLAERPPIAYGS